MHPEVPVYLICAQNPVLEYPHGKRLQSPDTSSKYSVKAIRLIYCLFPPDLKNAGSSNIPAAAPTLQRLLTSSPPHPTSSIMLSSYRKSTCFARLSKRRMKSHNWATRKNEISKKFLTKPKKKYMKLPQRQRSTNS